MSRAVAQERLRQLGHRRSGSLSTLQNVASGNIESNLFQVVAIVSDDRFNRDEFNRLWAIYGADGEIMCDLPLASHGEVSFDCSRGYLINSANPTMSRKSVHVLYSTAPYVRGNDECEEQLDPQLLRDFMAIREQYIPLIESQYPSLQFNDGTALSQELGIGVSFKFTLQPARPSLYKPEDLGKLMPLTALGNQTVIPEQTFFSLPRQTSSCPLVQKCG
jgi:hypothetical protein